MTCNPFPRWLSGVHPKNDVALGRLSAKIRTALRRRRRIDVARALQSPALQQIRVAKPSETSMDQALQDLGREPALQLNGELFTLHAPFLSALDRLCGAVVGSVKAPERQRDLRDLFVARLSRTSAGADAFWFVVRLLGLEDATDYVVMPRHARSSRKLDAPSVEVRRTPRGSLRARVRCVNKFALHRFCDGYDRDEYDASLLPRADSSACLTPQLQFHPPDGEDRPPSMGDRRHPEWLPIDTVILDDVDLSDADGPFRSERLLSVSVPHGWSRQVLS